MEIIRITRENWKAFESLMVVDAAAKILIPGSTFALGAVEDGNACGAIVVELAGQMANILSLYVLPEQRRKGYATELMIEAADFSVMCQPAYGFQVEFSVDLEEENGLEPFFRFCGLRLEEQEEEGCYYCLLEKASKVPILANKKQGGIKSFQNLTLSEKNSLTQEPPLFMTLYMKENQIEPDMSGFITEDGKIRGCCVFVNMDDELSLAWLRVEPDQKLGVIPLLQQALEAAAAKYPADTRIMIPVVNRQSKQLMEKLLQDALVQKETRWTGTLVFDEE